MLKRYQINNNRTLIEKKLGSCEFDDVKTCIMEVVFYTTYFLNGYKP